MAAPWRQLDATRASLGLLLGALVGCSPPDDATLAHSASATSTSATTATTTTSTSSSSTSDATTFDMTTAGPCGDECPEPHDLPPHVDCDTFVQDCPRGDKCMPWANDGGSAWNDTKCVPVVMDPDALGEPCQAEGSGVSGVDSCDEGLICWDVVPETLTGTCQALCLGTLEHCEQEVSGCCPEGSFCVFARVFAICRVRCDPLADECGPMHGCYGAGPWLECVPDVSGDMGAPGDPCDFINACDPGTYCGDPTTFPGCEVNAPGCCVPFCDLEAPTCPPGSECTPYYDLDPLGACVIPG